MISAYKKAQSLIGYIRMCGISSTDVHLTLTEREAFELLDTMRTQFQSQGGCPEFERDYSQAVELHDPWPMIHGVQVMGFPVFPMHGELQ